MGSMSAIDWIVVAVYFAGLVGIVYWSAQNQKTTADYFLAGRHAAWYVVGASLFASNIGSEHIVGLAGSGATVGFATAHYELHAWIMVLLAWVFVPFYYKSGVFTMPEFLEKRFDSKVRWVLSLVSLSAYVLTKVSVTVYAGALVFKTMLPDTFGTPDNAFWIGAFSTVILTGIYTMLGGLRAVMYTEVAQAGVLLLGSALITYFGLSQLGGWGELKSMATANAENFALWRPLSDPEFPWLGIMIASPVVGIWYWCTDQYIVQRTLAAKSLKEARRGALFGGFLKVWPVFIFLVPGLIGWALHEKGLMLIPADGEGLIDRDQVFAVMVTNLLPVGLRGLVVAGLLSALMSSLASLFNSCATLFTVDIYEKLRPGRPEKHLVNVGRFATLCVVIAGLIWIPIMHKMAGGGIYIYLQGVQSYLAPPITSVFLLGLLWRRTTSQAALWGMIVGFGLGMFKLTLEAISDNSGLEPGFLKSLADFNFLYYSGALLGFSIIFVVVVSLLTKPTPAAQLEGITFSTLSEQDKADIRQSWDKWDVYLTILVLGLVVGIYLYFSFWLT